MCGAERIYAEGHATLETYPLHTIIYRMRGVPQDGESACLWPVTQENVKAWRDVYNEKMRSVDNAATLTAYDERFILETGGAYFIHRDGKLLGIGWLSGCELLALAGVEPGEGTCVLQTLLSLADGEQVTLDVASTNIRALRLYEKNGFIKTEEMRRWYCVPQKQED
jgi:RimJ/RimL family protein N-acetyltransferase